MSAKLTNLMQKTKIFSWRVVLVWTLVLMPLCATGDNVDDLLERFDRSADVQVANRLFEQFLHAQVTEQPMTFMAKTNPDTLRLQVWYWSAEYFYASQQYPKAVEYGRKALPLYKKGNDRVGESDCLNLLAIAFIRLADYDQAADYAKQCYEIDRRRGDPDAMSSTLNTLAGIYMAAKRPAEAEKFVLRGIEECKKADNPKRLAVLHGMASEVYHAMGKETDALKYAETAYQMEVKLGRKDKVAVRQTQMATALLWLKRVPEAKAALEKALPQLRADNNMQSLGIACNQMGGVMMAEKKEGEAVRYYREAAEIFLKLKDHYNECHARLGLYNALKTTNPKAAFAEMDRYRELKDSIYDHEAIDALSRYDAQYKNNELREAHEAERASKYRMGWVALAIVVGLLLLAATIWMIMRRRHHQQQKVNRELSADINELREQYQQLHLQYDNAMFTRQEGQDNDLKPADRDFLKQAVALVNEQIDQGQVDVASVVEHMNMSPFQFRQRLVAVTGQTPQAFFQMIRMRRARHLLDNHSELNIAQVAVLCAYNETPNFTRAFKKVFGVTPTQYVERRSKKQTGA